MINYPQIFNNNFYFYFLNYKVPSLLHFVACFTAKQGIRIDNIKTDYFRYKELERESERTHLYLVRKLSLVFRFLQTVALIPFYFV